MYICTYDNWYSLADLQLGCPIPIANDPDKVVIPQGRTPDKIVQNLSYIVEDKKNEFQSPPLFGGHQSWLQREKSFRLKSTMKVIEIFSLYSQLVEFLVYILT